MLTAEDLEFLKSAVSAIKKNVDLLEVRFNRHFTIDGLLAGSIGELLAYYYYDIELKDNNMPVHDATQLDKSIQIKMTQRSQIEIKGEPDYLIVLFVRITADSLDVFEVFNGPCIDLIRLRKVGKNGERSFSLTQLSKENAKVKVNSRIKVREGLSVRPWSYYNNVNGGIL